MRLIRSIHSGTGKHVACRPYTYFRFSNSQNKKHIASMALTKHK